MRSLTALGAAVAVLGFATAASAADMPARTYTKAPPMAAPFNWTGFYLGLNAGYGWVDSGGSNPGGFVGGGQIGYNWQGYNSPLVLGIEADLQGADIDESVTVGGVTATTRAKAFGTVRGRIGYAFDRAMIYATGGWAYTRTSLDLSGPGGSISSSDWSSGWALGGGVEYAFMGPWSAKLEYLHVDSGDVTLTLAGTSVTGNYDMNVVRAGLNYRF
ncbi:MAG: porin family protein [Pseudolabrys sp.]|nr:porin family protein [Pseudolabrys sp.]